MSPFISSQEKTETLGPSKEKGGNPLSHEKTPFHCNQARLETITCLRSASLKIIRMGITKKQEHAKPSGRNMWK